MFFNVSDQARTLSAIATALSEILGCPGVGMIHTYIQQRIDRRVDLMLFALHLLRIHVT